MSVKRGTGNLANTELKKSVEQVEAKQETASALFALSFKAQIKADRAAGTNIITDDVILQSTELVDYPEWVEGAAYTVGDILKSNGLFYEVIAAHTSNAAYPVETTFGYYRIIELAHTGALDDPIPYPEAAGIVVNVVNGKYYSYKGAVYLAKADMPNCVYPPDTAAMWQWEVVE